MNHYSIIGPSGTPVFEAECADIVPGCVCLGRILDLDAVPEALRANWEELEQCANDQIIPRAEQILAEIDAMELAVRGLPYLLRDVHVMQVDRLSFVPIERSEAQPSAPRG